MYSSCVIENTRNSYFRHIAISTIIKTLLHVTIRRPGVERMLGA